MEAFVAGGGAATAFAGRPRPLLLPRRAPPLVVGVGCRLLPPPRAGAGGEPELDKWDLMELKFGRLLGEDAKLTLAKILAKKSSPDVTSLDVEKLVENKKDSLNNMLNNFLDVSRQGQTSKSPKNKQTLNLSRPVMSKAMQDKQSMSLSQPVTSKAMRDKQSMSLSRPVMSKPMQDNRPSKKSLVVERDSSELKSTFSKSSAEIALRKPTVFHGEDDELKLKLKPNLVLKMRGSYDENLHNVTLLKKPEVQNVSSNPNQQHASADSMPSTSGKKDQNEIGMELNSRDISYDKTEINDELQTSDAIGQNGLNNSENDSMTTTEISNLEETLGMNGNYTRVLPEVSADPNVGLPPAEQSLNQEMDTSASPVDDRSVNSSDNISTQPFFLGKPKRSDSSIERVLHLVTMEKGSSEHNESYIADEGNVLSSTKEDIDESDWKRLEHCVSTGEKVEGDVINCSPNGFVVSLGSLIGFLPYRNLAPKWKFIAFESWLRKKGVDPSLYRQNPRIVKSSDVNNMNIELESENLLQAYDQEKTKFLSSFIGQRIRVSVVQADRNSKRILFSTRQKENKESLEKKRSLMARLTVGDVVKCRITRFAYFGIFVEVEGVPALIHPWEVSWDETLDPSTSFTIGQVVDAKVVQLDYTAERIFLSLKDLAPDTLIGALESVVGDQTSLDGTLEAAQTDVEWPDVESLVKELQKIQEVSSVSKGRFFLSPGLAPTFQVYMAPMFDSKYKLLARYGNNVQEIVVQASLDKEQMKDAILACTNRYPHG